MLRLRVLSMNKQSSKTINLLAEKGDFSLSIPFRYELTYIYILNFYQLAEQIAKI
jgi:hypothetical protein